MPEKTILVLFRRDLRIADNPALHAAHISGARVVPLYIHSPEEESPWAEGGAGKVWLHNSLKSLDNDLQAKGAKLTLRRGPILETIKEIVQTLGAQGVYWNRCYEPYLIPRDARIKAALREQGLEVKSFNGSLLVEAPKFLNKQSKPYQVFTPFYKSALQNLEHRPPLPTPKTLRTPGVWPHSEALESLELLPRIPWHIGIESYWQPGEAQAMKRLKQFARGKLSNYPEGRDYPAKDEVSRLSPHLHFGEISPWQILHTLQAELAGGMLESQAGAYMRQVYWREFAHYLLYHFPHTTHEPLHAKFCAFPWRNDAQLLHAWQRGQTGYPLVDAGMRELWETGWMHNRVRMVVASFLVKNLMQPWQAGAAWFWGTLVDADLANNTLGWQWVAGCGADAAPYFRIFNPVMQGVKFDPEGAYVRRWIPELSKLPLPHLHQPWKAPEALLKNAGITLGLDYPLPIVDLTESRERALAAYDTIR